MRYYVLAVEGLGGSVSTISLPYGVSSLEEFLSLFIALDKNLKEELSEFYIQNNETSYVFSSFEEAISTPVKVKVIKLCKENITSVYLDTLKFYNCVIPDKKYLKGIKYFSLITSKSSLSYYVNYFDVGYYKGISFLASRLSLYAGFFSRKKLDLSLSYFSKSDKDFTNYIFYSNSFRDTFSIYKDYSSFNARVSVFGSIVVCCYSYLSTFYGVSSSSDKSNIYSSLKAISDVIYRKQKYARLLGSFNYLNVFPLVILEGYLEGVYFLRSLDGIDFTITVESGRALLDSKLGTVEFTEGNAKTIIRNLSKLERGTSEL